MFRLQTTIAQRSAIYSTAAARNTTMDDASETGKELFNSIHNKFHEGVSNKKLRWLSTLFKLEKVKTEDRNARMKNMILEKLQEKLQENEKLIVTYQNKIKFNKRRGIIDIRRKIFTNIDDLRIVLDLICGDITNMQMEN